MQKINTIWAALLGLGMAATLGGCAKEGKTSTNVLFVNAVADGPTLDGYLQGQLRQGSIATGNATKYVAVEKSESSAYSAEMRNETTNSNLVTISNPTWNGGYNSVWAMGTTQQPYQATVPDVFGAPPAGKASIRFVHAAFNAPGIDLFVGGKNVVRNITFIGKNKPGYSPFNTVDVGTAALAACKTGTSTPLVILPALDIEAGKIYTVYIQGITPTAEGQTLALGVIEHHDALK